MGHKLYRDESDSPESQKSIWSQKGGGLYKQISYNTEVHAAIGLPPGATEEQKTNP